MRYTNRMFKAAIGASVLSIAFGSASFAGARTCVEPPPGLVSWWPGDGDARDIVGESDGVLQNGATFADGLVGQAFSFDGVDDFVSAPHNESQDLREALTIDAWIMRTGPCLELNCIVLMKEDVPAPFEEDLRYGLNLPRFRGHLRKVDNNEIGGLRCRNEDRVASTATSTSQKRFD